MHFQNKNQCSVVLLICTNEHCCYGHHISRLHKESWCCSLCDL